MCYTGLCTWENHEGDCQWPGWYKKMDKEFNTNHLTKRGIRGTIDGDGRR